MLPSVQDKVILGLLTYPPKMLKNKQPQKWMRLNKEDHDSHFLSHCGVGRHTPKQSLQVNRRDVALAFKTTFLGQENKRTDIKNFSLKLELLGSPSILITEEIQKTVL